jgi:hypothetical protein
LLVKGDVIVAGDLADVFLGHVMFTGDPFGGVAQGGIGHDQCRVLADIVVGPSTSAGTTAFDVATEVAGANRWAYTGDRSGLMVNVAGTLLIW